MILVWELSSGKVLRKIEGHEGYVSAVAVNADGTRALTGGGTIETRGEEKVKRDYQFRFWDLDQGKELRKQDTPGQESAVFCPALSADAKLGLIAMHSGTWLVWDMVGWKEVHQSG